MPTTESTNRRMTCDRSRRRRRRSRSSSNRVSSSSTSTSSSGSSSKVNQRRQRSSGTSGKPNALRFKLVAVLMASYCSIGKLSSTAAVVVAFRASPPRMSSNTRVANTRAKSQQLDATSLEAARELVTKEASGSTRVTKKALLESIGYGVMDPLAYQTFENSPLPPQLRPTTHVRIAEGIHSFGQEFLGVPPEESSSLFSESAAPAEAAGVGSQRAIAAGGRSSQFELHPKLPGVGIRMTVLRLRNGELLVHSPVAPTVELLDMLRDSFPAVGPATKVHLFSASVSPEHWAFLKYWKEIFPSAEVWAVPGPHRRLMGVEVNHDIEQICGVPEQLGGEVEVAVLEGVPMVREALLLHRPTGTVLSAALLLAMNQNTLEQHVSNEGEQRRGVAPPPTTLSATPSSPPSPLASPLKQPKRFGEHSDRPAKVGTVSDSGSVKNGRWRRARWGLLDKTASLLDMNTLAVFAPVKTLMHAFKGNSAAFSSRVLGWDAKAFVGCYGQSPLEGPELNAMLYAALGRYVDPPKKKTEKKKLGTRLLALMPGRHGGQNNDGNQDVALEQGVQLPGATYTTDSRFPPGGGGGDGDSSGSGSFASAAGVPRHGAVPRPAATASSPAASPTAEEASRQGFVVTPAGQTARQAQTKPLSSREPRTAAATVRSTKTPPETFADGPREPNTADRTTVPAAASAKAPPPPPTPAAIIADNGEGDIREDASTPPAASVVVDAATTDDKGRGFNLAGMVAGWGKRGTDSPPANRKGRERNSDKSQPPKPQRQREPRRLSNQQQPTAETISTTATSSATPKIGRNGKFSGTGSAEFEDENAIPGATAAAASTTRVTDPAMSEVEKRARQYVQEKAEAAGDFRAGTVGDTIEGVVEGAVKLSPGIEPSTVSRTSEALEAGRRSAKVENEANAAGAAEDNGNPFVVGPDSRYDERPAEEAEEDSKGDDPFEEPFYPFADEGPLLNGNGRPPQ